LYEHEAANGVLKFSVIAYSTTFLHKSLLQGHATYIHVLAFVAAFDVHFISILYSIASWCQCGLCWLHLNKFFGQVAIATPPPLSPPCFVDFGISGFTTVGLISHYCSACALVLEFADVWQDLVAKLVSIVFKCWVFIFGIWSLVWWKLNFCWSMIKELVVPCTHLTCNILDGFTLH
jgi:hypothetical protein